MSILHGWVTVGGMCDLTLPQRSEAGFWRVIIIFKYLPIWDICDHRDWVLLPPYCKTQLSLALHSVSWFLERKQIAQVKCMSCLVSGTPSLPIASLKAAPTYPGTGWDKLRENSIIYSLIWFWYFCVCIIFLRQSLCNPNWHQTHCVAEGDFEFLSLLPTFTSLVLRWQANQMTPHPVYMASGIKPRTSHRLDKPFTSWATAPSWLKRCSIRDI